MATQTFHIEVECEVRTMAEALAEAAEDKDEDSKAWILSHTEHYPMPIKVLKVTCDGKPVKDEDEDYMEHRFLIAGTGGDGYTLSITHYII